MTYVPSLGLADEVKFIATYKPRYYLLRILVQWR